MVLVLLFWCRGAFPLETQVLAFWIVCGEDVVVADDGMMIV